MMFFFVIVSGIESIVNFLVMIPFWGLICPGRFGVSYSLFIFLLPSFLTYKLSLFCEVDGVLNIPFLLLVLNILGSAKFFG